MYSDESVETSWHLVVNCNTALLTCLLMLIGGKASFFVV